MPKQTRRPDPDKGEAPMAVTSVTETVPHPADATSAPGPYDMPIDRPPVSTNKPDTPIANSLVAGAGAPHTEGQTTAPFEETVQVQTPESEPQPPPQPEPTEPEPENPGPEEPAPASRRTVK